jgi:dihydroorotase/N-acyl-D-amino-acid deacylase
MDTWRMTARHALVLCLVLVPLAAASLSAQPSVDLLSSAGYRAEFATGEQVESYDVVIDGGMIVDGTGNPYFRADVGIRGGTIARIGRLGNAAAGRRIDATGLVVAPGFIDPHTHARGRIFEMPLAESYLLQGITTVIDGNDGGSPLPIGEFLDSLARHRISPNFALYVGHGTIRRAVMGMADREPTADELERMKPLVARGMEEGALGLSTGLAYAPGYYAETEEIIALARMAAAYGGIYISHMRNEAETVLESVRETIRIGKEAAIPVQMTHHKVGGHRQFGQSAQSIELMTEARSRGVDITFDQYPYTASSTGISFLIPRWAHADGRIQENLRDTSARARIKESVLEFIEGRFNNDASKIQLVSCRFDQSLAGKTIADLLKDAGDPLTPEAAAEKVIELQENGGCGAIFHSFAEPDVERLLQSEYGMIGSDGSLTPVGEGSPHPRAYGTYPRVLGRYVRERRILSLEAAVRKMTSFPAQRLGLNGRGLIREGMIADIVVLDPKTIADRATFVEPHQYSVGVRYVMIHGELAIDEGRHTGARPGRVLYGPGKESHR